MRPNADAIIQYIKMPMEDLRLTESLFNAAADGPRQQAKLTAL